MNQDDSLLKFEVPEIIYGLGALYKIGQCAKRLGGERVLLVTDPGVMEAGWVDETIKHLEQEDLKYVIYDNVVTNPRDFQVEEGAQLYVQKKCDVIAAVGGGSPIDMAKGIAILVSNHGQIQEYEGCNRISQPIPPLVCAPTTAGTGADVTQFAIITTPLGFAEVDHRELRFHDLQSQTKRTKSVRFLKGCFQRHIYYTGRKQIFAQTHFSTHRIKTLLEVFPDARFIYMDRSPFETLPSYFSLNHGVVDQVWGMGNFEAEQISRYFRNRYQASIELCRYFHDVVENEEIDRKKILKIQYDSLRNDLVGVFENIVSFGGLEPSGELRALVQNRAARQPHYRRVHEVRPIEHFGIGEDEVARDFAFLLEGRST